MGSSLVLQEAVLSRLLCANLFLLEYVRAIDFSAASDYGESSHTKMNPLLFPEPFQNILPCKPRTLIGIRS